jgi:nucleotide-binding universal stress UspA family protein
MKNVVVPVDFSKTSATAVQIGAQLAKLMGMNLRIVHVCDLVLSGSHSLTTPEQQKDEAELGKKLAKFVQKYVPAPQGSSKEVPQVRLSVLSGVAAHKIKSLSKKFSTALIVMGGVGAGVGVKMPGVYGSVATPVVMRSGCPIMLIPKGHKSTKINRLAIAFDEADEVSRIGKFSRRIVEALQPELRYVHVSKASWPAEIETEEDFIHLTLGKAFSDYSFKFDILPEGEVVDRLTQYTKDEEIDLLVLGGKRQGFWQRLFDDHHLKPILRACEVPMLIIPFASEEE